MKRILVIIAAAAMLMTAALAQEAEGGRFTLSHYLGGEEENLESVTLSFRGETYEIDPGEFIMLARDIWLEDVENRGIKNGMDAGNMQNVLYIQTKAEGSLYGEYVALTPRGEADRYALFMSRMMMCDFEINRSDVKQLYGLLPQDVRPPIPLGDEVYIVCGILLAAVIFAAGYLTGRKIRK